VDEVLAVLKDDGLNDRQRRIEIDGLLGLDRLSDDEFSSLTILARSLTDYQSTQMQLDGDAKEDGQRYQDQAHQDIAIDPDDEEDMEGEGHLVHEIVEEEGD
jgi:hypothetical protein